jgi:hypothetical protein
VRSVSREEVWASAGVQGAWVSGCGCEADWRVVGNQDTDPDYVQKEHRAQKSGVGTYFRCKKVRNFSAHQRTEPARTVYERTVYENKALPLGYFVPDIDPDLRHVLPGYRIWKCVRSNQEFGASLEETTQLLPQLRREVPLGCKVPRGCLYAPH